MMDNIDRLNKPEASSAKIKYGRGTVTCETNGEIAAFQIDFVGAIKAVKKLGNGWTIKIGEKKIVIFSMAQTELKELLFTYVGELEITGCKYATWDRNISSAKIINLNQNEWNINYGEWGSDARKPEEIITQEIIGRKVKKSSI